MVFATRGAKHLHGKEYDDLIGEIGSGNMNGYTDDMAEYVRLTAQDGDVAQDNDTAQHHEVQNNNPRETNLDGMDTSAAEPIHGAGSRSAEGSNHGNGDDDDLDLEELDPYTDEESYPQGHQKRRQVSLTQGHRHLSMHRQQRQVDDGTVLQNPQRQLLQCLLLEAGILFHSIFIGMALSVATGTSFIVLLIAISFHQTFEGFALGSRIASLIPDLFSPSSPKPWLMACAYGTTTPIGQAIGLVLHNLYDPASTMGLLMVGFTNAVSSGLLIFAGLVELLAEDFLSDSSYETLRGKRRVEACIAVASGAMLMALLHLSSSLHSVEPGVWLQSISQLPILEIDRDVSSVKHNSMSYVFF
ncbi:ZIP family zinc transporter, partial [Rasamsonia emersonii CBS 393.64]